MDGSALTARRPRPIAVSLAWRRYLVTTRTAPAEAYEQVEEAAWARLRSELEAAESG